MSTVILRFGVAWLVIEDMDKNEDHQTQHGCCVVRLDGAGRCHEKLEATRIICTATTKDLHGKIIHMWPSIEIRYCMGSHDVPQQILFSVERGSLS